MLSSSSSSSPRVLVEYQLPETARITPELLLASVDRREAALLEQMPTIVEAVAMLLATMREGALVQPRPRLRRRDRRELARGAVRDAMAEEPRASLSRLALVTGYSRSYVCELRREVLAELAEQSDP